MSRLSLTLTTIVVLLAPGPAHAGNDDTYFMSGEAALMGGAVVALGQSSGMLWYNPAGLGAIHRNQYDVTLSGGAYQRRRVEGGLRLTLPGATGDVELRSDLDGSRTTTIAPAAVYARRFGKVTLGAGFFTSRDEVIRLSSFDRTPTDTGEQAETHLDFDVAETRYHIGGGLGFELLGGTLKLGLSLFAVLDGTNDSLAVGASLSDPADPMGERAESTGVALDDSSRWALATHIGAQVHPTDWLQLGLTLRLPMLLLSDSPDNSAFLQAGRQERDPATDEIRGATTSTSVGPRPSAGVGQLEPMRLMLGAGLLLGGVRVGVGFDYSPALEALDVRQPGATDPEYLVRRTSVWNLRAGALVPASDTIAIGFGLFTDRSARPTPQSFGEFRVDYYGGTFGLRIDTPVGLAEDEEAETLVFRTTLALRYAYGSGDTRSSPST